MRMIVEVRFEDPSDGGGEPQRLSFERVDGDLSKLGLRLEEGRRLTEFVQASLVRRQGDVFLETIRPCPHCGKHRSVKGHHLMVYRTAFGRMTIESPRYRPCGCTGTPPRMASFSPLVTALPYRTDPEFEYLQVRWAAHLPYGATVKLLSEVLPVTQAVSVSGLKDRVWAVGQELHDRIEQAIKDETAPPDRGQRSSVTALGVDSAWLKHCDARVRGARWVNIVTGRAMHVDGSTRVYGYVTKQVSSPAARMDHFLTEQGVGPDEPVTVLSDGAPEFQKATERSSRPIQRVLDWFHIAMKCQAVVQSARPHEALMTPTGRTMGREVATVKWLIWHGKGKGAVERLTVLEDMFGLVPESCYYNLHWNIRQLRGHLEGNEPFLVNYGKRYRQGLPIGSGIAESAVNQVVSRRFAKKRQMRWSDEGAHLLVQVRVAVLNGELKPRAVPTPCKHPA